MIRKGVSGFPSCATNKIARDDVSSTDHRTPDRQHCCGRWGVVVADGLGNPMIWPKGRAAQSVERRRSETPSGFAGAASDFAGSILMLSTFGVSTRVATSACCDTEPV